MNLCLCCEHFVNKSLSIGNGFVYLDYTFIGLTARLMLDNYRYKLELHYHPLKAKASSLLMNCVAFNMFSLIILKTICYGLL